MKFTNEGFAGDLANLINQYSIENNSNTPDFILANYLCDCLRAFEFASTRREQWYGKELKIGDTLK